MNIEGSVALVTGASSGIGAVVATDLARRGARVVVTARRQSELEQTAEQCRRHSPESFGVVADLAEPADCRRVVAEATEALGRVDIIVNNAGLSIRRHALDTTPEDVERLMRVNFFGAVHTTMAALPGMVQRRRGCVVNVTSVAGYIPNPKEAAYGASKAALSLWSHVLLVDLAGTGVHVGVLSPGPIDTEIWAKDEEAAYHGPKFPPQVVADGVAKIVEHDVAHLTVPRRYGAMAPMYALPGISRAVRRGLVRFGQASERRR